MKAFDQDTDHGYYGTNRSAHLVSNILVAIFYILQLLDILLIFSFKFVIRNCFCNITKVDSFDGLWKVDHRTHLNGDVKWFDLLV